MLSLRPLLRLCCWLTSKKSVAVVVSETVDVASVVVALRAETMPVLKVPIMMRLIRRTLAAENAIVRVFI